MIFPVINGIDDVLKHVEGRDDFAVMDRGDFVSVDYLFAGEDTFDHPIRRECRGIKFRANGELLARPYHKFFNIGEKEDTQPHVIDIGKPHVVLDKLDGSMIHPAKINDDIVFMTRAGVTNIAEDARAFASGEVLAACESALSAGLTPIFEWCSLRNRIVIRYDQPRLVLTGIRNNLTGAYGTMQAMHEFAQLHNIPDIVGAYGKVEALDAFIARARALKDAEGYVVRFEDGHMLKMKADDYVMRHRAKDAINLEKNALAAILSGSVDDMLPLLTEDDVDALKRYAGAVDGVVSELAGNVQEVIQEAQSAGADQKTFALEYASKLDGPLRSTAFRGFAGGDVRGFLCELLGKSCKSQGRVDAIRPLLGGIDWHDYLNSVQE